MDWYKYWIRTSFILVLMVVVWFINQKVVEVLGSIVLMHGQHLILSYLNLFLKASCILTKVASVLAGIALASLWVGNDVVESRRRWRSYVINGVKNVAYGCSLSAVSIYVIALVFLAYGMLQAKIFELYPSMLKSLNASIALLHVYDSLISIFGLTVLMPLTIAICAQLIALEGDVFEELKRYIDELEEEISKLVKGNVP